MIHAISSIARWYTFVLTVTLLISSKPSLLSLFQCLFRINIPMKRNST